MSTELYWMGLTVLMTSLFWMPYVLNRFVELGTISEIANPNAELQPKAQWAKRTRNAHANAVENLIIVVPLVLAVHITGTSSALTAGATMSYFYARMIHYIGYSIGFPAVRTLSFLAGFACQIILGLSLLGWV